MTAGSWWAIVNCFLFQCFANSRFVLAGHPVYVIADAVSSCNPQEKPLALKRLAQHGAVITTSESFLYEVVGDACKYLSNCRFFYHPCVKILTSCLALPIFKEVIKLVKAESANTKHGLQVLASNL